MTENQKLREAIKRLLKAHRITVQAPPKTITDAENQIAEIQNAVKFAEEAIALPTAEQVDDINVAESFTNDTKAKAQAQELPDERAAFEAEMRCEETWGHRSLARNKLGGYSNWCVDLMWSIWQARAALSAGDAVDAKRWKTSELISRVALTPPDKRTEQMNIAFNAYRKAMESGQSYAACVDAAIDAAMRKGQL